SSRLLIIRKLLTNTGRNRFTIAWNPMVPPDFQGNDRLEATLQGDAIVFLSLDEQGQLLYGIWCRPEKVTVVDNVMKTIISFPPREMEPAAVMSSSASFAKRLLTGMEAY